MFATARSMRSRLALALVGTAALLLGGCGGGGGSSPAAGGEVRGAQAFSTICPELTGNLAILWDVYNGVTRTDDVLPPAVPSGPTFVHPHDATLAFSHPTGWTPEVIGDGLYSTGVDLMRDDEAALWRQVQTIAQTTPRAEHVRDLELDALLTHLGLEGGPIESLCDNTITGEAGDDLRFSSSTLIFRAGEHTAVVHATVIPFPFTDGPFGGLGTASVRVKVCLAPTAEFDTRALDTFLAIDWQLRTSDDATIFDRDGDGWHDAVDAAPADPDAQ